MKKNFLILSTVFGTFLMFSALALAQNSTDKAAASAAAPSNPEYKSGELVEAADYRGIWYKSKITGIENGKYHVHFFGFESAWDEWVTADKIRYSEDYDFGREVEVELKGVWYKALIIDSRFNTEHLVSYVDFSYLITTQDEWVKDERIREGGEGWRYGRIVEVAYGKSWRRAQILKRRAGEVYVHYEGESDVWNEWVRTDKIRRIR